MHILAVQRVSGRVVIIEFLKIRRNHGSHPESSQDENTPTLTLHSSYSYAYSYSYYSCSYTYSYAYSTLRELGLQPPISGPLFRDWSARISKRGRGYYSEPTIRLWEYCPRNIWGYVGANLRPIPQHLLIVYCGFCY